MSKPIIIFGAGASHSLKEMRESQISDLKFAPPLTNNLFSEAFSEISDKYHELKLNLTQIDTHIKSASVEKYLESLEKEGSPLEQRQLIEVKLYLAEVFQRIEDKFLRREHQTATFYHHFLHQLQKSYPQGATIITFNYDIFLDRAMNDVFGYRYDDISSYYHKRAYELFKVHGSMDWKYYFRLNPPFKPPSDIKEKVSLILRIKDERLANNLDFPIPDLIQNYPPGNILEVPALAIPMTTEKGYLIADHEKLIPERLKAAREIMIVGWSASDDFFVEEIMKNIPYQQVKFKIQSLSSPEKTLKRFTHKMVQRKIEPKLVPGCFSAVTTRPNLLREFIED